MSDRERLGAALALAFFLHFLFARIDSAPATDAPAFVVAIERDESSLLRAADAVAPGAVVDAATPERDRENEQRDRKRRAYLRYLDEVDAAIHARRLDAGDNGLIGVVVCAFTILADGVFNGERVVMSSGNPRLDEAALNAIIRASGVVPRPEIIGAEPINVSLPVKYQYGLE